MTNLSTNYLSELWICRVSCVLISQTAETRATQWTLHPGNKKKIHIRGYIETQTWGHLHRQSWNLRAAAVCFYSVDLQTQTQVNIHYLLVLVSGGYSRYVIFAANVDISRRPRRRRTAVKARENSCRVCAELWLNATPAWLQKRRTEQS